jgi:hypothetical protein
MSALLKLRDRYGYLIEEAAKSLPNPYKIDLTAEFDFCFDRSIRSYLKNRPEESLKDYIAKEIALKRKAWASILIPKPTAMELLIEKHSDLIGATSKFFQDDLDTQESTNDLLSNFPNFVKSYLFDRKRSNLPGLREYLSYRMVSRCREMIDEKNCSNFSQEGLFQDNRDIADIVIRGYHNNSIFSKEDIHQELLVRIYEAAGKYIKKKESGQKVGNPRAFLMLSCKNLLRDFFRKLAVRKATNDDTDYDLVLNYNGESSEVQGVEFVEDKIIYGGVDILDGMDEVGRVAVMNYLDGFMGRSTKRETIDLVVEELKGRGYNYSPSQIRRKIEVGISHLRNTYSDVYNEMK